MPDPFQLQRFRDGQEDVWCWPMKGEAPMPSSVRPMI